MNDFLDETIELRPQLYSKLMVLLFSVFLTPIGGAMLMFVNLITLKKWQHGVGVLLLSVMYVWISSLIAIQFGVKNGVTFLGNFIGAYLLIHPVWNKTITVKKEYRYKNPFVPIAVAVILMIISLLYVVTA